MPFTYPDKGHISRLLELLNRNKIGISNTFIHDTCEHKNQLLVLSGDGSRTIQSIYSSFYKNLSMLKDTFGLLGKRNQKVFCVSYLKKLLDRNKKS